MLQRNDLWSLERYAEERPAFRAKVLAHKENRRVALGSHLLLMFEDELTVRYQVQEMLRIEKVFEPAGIQEELDAYNPLIPDGDNWKCSLLIQYGDVEVRRQKLQQLLGIEERLWAQVGGGAKVFPIADEDLERSTEDKTSAVHFLRYQLSAEMRAAAQRGEPIVFGVEHPAYPTPPVQVPEAVRAALAADLTARP